MKKTRIRKAWLVEHGGLGTGIFTAYHSKAKAEYEITKELCECAHKPIRCTITYSL